MSDPFKDALRKSSQKLNCCCDTGFVCPTHGAMGKTSDTPETDTLDWSSAIGDTLEQRRTQLARIHGVTSRLERQRNEAREEAANWKQLYVEAVERGNLFKFQRDEARAEATNLQTDLYASCNAEGLRQAREENARLLDLLREVRFVAYQPPLVREMISALAHDPKPNEPAHHP